MTCPFCGKEMAKGILSGDGRCRVRWKAGEKKADIWDTLSDMCSVTAISYGLSYFTAESYFCKGCKKLILDTDVEKQPSAAR